VTVVVPERTASVNEKTLRGGSVRPALLATAILILAVSRLLPIPGEPWEQDEALFATAAFSTDLEQHHPHPPGFPLWIAAAKIGLWIVGDPVIALQAISALLSILTVVLLAKLWATALGDECLGWSAALLYAFLPGVWFHAPRAFTTTPALAAAAAAAVVWLRPGRRSLVGGAVLLAVAILIRPILAVPLLAIALGAVWLRRDKPRDILTAAVFGSVFLGIGFTPLVIDSGGLVEFLRLTTSHGADHGGALHLAPWTFAGLGVVRAVGGTSAATALMVLSTLGCCALARHRRELPWALLMVFAISLAWVLLAHNRTYTRYTLPVLALATGPAVFGLRTLVRSNQLTATLACAAAAASAVWTAPALVALATERFPPLAALESAQRRHDVDVVIVDGALSPFGDLLAITGRARLPIVWRPLLAEGRVPDRLVRGTWAYVRADGTPSAAVPAPDPPPEVFACSQVRLAALAQDRFLRTEVWRGGGVVLEPTYPRTRKGTAVWLDGPLEILVQPTPPGSWLGAILAIDATDASMGIVQDGLAADRVNLNRGRATVHIPLPRPSAQEAPITPSSVIVDVTGSGERVLLERVWLDTPGGPPPPLKITPAQQANGLDDRISGGGFYRVEQIGSPPRAGRWTADKAWLSVPAACGTLTLQLTTPSPRPAVVGITCEQLGWSTQVEVHSGWRDPVIVPVEIPLTRLVLRFEIMNAFVPAERNPASGDHRTLGVMLGDITFEPGGSTTPG